MKTLSKLASELRQNTTAVKLSFSWLGTRKTLNTSQRVQAASTFNADHRSLSASQKLFDTSHPTFKALTSLKTDITDYWRLNTLPYTEDGIRLIHRDKLEAFKAQMQEYLYQFNDAVAELEKCLAELKIEAQKRLGSLFDPSNYPESIKAHFAFEWSFPSIEPPEYLAKLSPETYKAEQDKLKARLAEAVSLAEAAFLTEFKEMVANLHERLTPAADGTKKVFRDSAVNNLTDFFKRFKELNIGSNAELDAVVTEAEALVKNISAKDLRDSELLRKEIAADLAKVGEKLTPLVVNQPRRRIIKPQLPQPAQKETPNEQLVAV